MLDKFWPIFNINTFGAIVKGNMRTILISIQKFIFIYTQETTKNVQAKLPYLLFPNLKVSCNTVHFYCLVIVP